MRLKYLSLLCAVTALLLAALACSGDDDDTGGNGDQPAATTEAAGDGDGDGDEPTATSEAPGGDGGFGSGTGTLTIGDETWEITGVGCVFSAEEARNPDFPFNLAGSSESADGEDLYVAADIYDPSGQERLEGEGVSHNIEIYDFNFEDPTVSWSSFDDVTGFLGNGTITVITIDGKNIHGEGDFDDGTTDEIEAVPGTMDVSCP